MTKLLVLNSSVTGADSVSSRLTHELVELWHAAEPELAVTQRDLGANPVPHLHSEGLPGLFGRNEGVARDTLALSDALIAEVTAADVLVIGAPMYNYGIPSTLKAWFDHVLRGGVTFRYTAEGPVGLLVGKRAIVMEARGGFYSAGPAAVKDAQEPHLRAMLGLMGITDVHFIRAEGLKISPEAGEAAIAAALDELRVLAENRFVGQA